MPGVAVVGTQWGDEGKGKIVDTLTEFADTVVRFQGGANAGHTLIVGDERIVLHLVPSGALRPNTRCVLGPGMVVDPEALLEEFAALERRGAPLAPGRLVLSPRCHVLLPLHKAADEAEERRRGAAGIGTTRRGIGPCYEDKAARRGLRFADLDDAAGLLARLQDATEARRHRLETHGVAVPDPQATADALLAAWTRLRPYVADGPRLIHEDLRAGRNVLFEGAQGALLDIDHGTYPFVTSSTTVSAGACQGAGVPPAAIDAVVGVTKAYTTRVGNGPFPTEAEPAVAERMRQAGGEFGATTGRPRRCGWLDVPALRYAARIDGLTALALTKIDVLCAAGPEIKVCVAYRVDGALETELPIDRLDRAEPVYETLPGLPDGIRHARAMDDLAPAARRVLETLERWIGVPVGILSVGPRRSETILLGNPFHRGERSVGARRGG